MFNASVAIPETGSWVGYDIDARSLPSNAIITGIVLHHSVTHPRVSDLQVKLYSDAGTQWNIRQNSGGWNANYDEYATDTTIFTGSPAAQMYHYRVADTYANNMVGTLTGLEIWICYQIPSPPRI